MNEAELLCKSILFRKRKKKREKEMPVFTDGSLSLVQIWPGSGSDLADLRREIIEFDACQGSSLTRQLHGLFSNHLFIFQKKKKT